MSVITSQNRVSEKTAIGRENLYRLFTNRPMDDEDLLVNLSMYMRSGSMAKLLFVNEIYQKVLNIPGAIFEFGIWMGATTIALENLRAVYEPYNHQRRIVAFDTFEGYVGIGKLDIRSKIIEEGVYTVSEGYEKYLEELLDYHEQENVMSHIKKHTLIKGDASITCPNYLEANPHILIALAYFDMALYEPTRKCLEVIMPRLIKGSVLVFDELCHPDYPGETQAVIEVLGSRNFEIQKSKFLPDRSFVVIS